MKAEDVARYLQDNPQFFEMYADTLAQIWVPHPHGGRTISITERQILTLRDRAKAFEHKLAELIRFGEENDAIGNKVHRLTLALLGAPDVDAICAAVLWHLREDFAVPHLALRLWALPGRATHARFEPVTETVRAYAQQLTQPYCGASGPDEVRSWLEANPERIRSVALVSIRHGDEVFGLLVLGSEEASRFYPDMGTLYLERIGEVIAAALAGRLGWT